MKDFYKQRLLSLADFLEKVPDKHFNMDNIADDSDGCHNLDEKFQEIINNNLKEISCGTAACAIGWMPGAFPSEFKWNEIGDVININNGRKNFSAAEFYFNIDQDQSYYLFMPGEYYNDTIESNDDYIVPKKEVIDRIRNFANSEYFDYELDR